MTEEMTVFEKVRMQMVSNALSIYQFLNGLSHEEIMGKYDTLWKEATEKGIQHEMAKSDYILLIILVELKNQIVQKPEPEGMVI